ncbi:MAG TPA: tyrosine-type recombinase/integrase [Urbifossiella sp.]|nr:tyrosine-type recombinase/integrase [Urbifossiella sp.]
MPRAPSISYWPTRKGGGYFCVRKGERFELALGPDDQPTGPTYRKAQDRFQAIMEGKEREEAQAEQRRLNPGRATVREVLDAYLKHITKTKTPGTVEIRLRSFVPFTNHPVKGGLLGERFVADLTHQDVYAFLEDMETVPKAQVRKKVQKGRKPTTWGLGSQRNFMQGVLAAFNWAVTGKMLPENPLAGIEKPGSVSRGAEALLGTNAAEIEAAHARILSVSRAHWHPFIQALKETGARPGELGAATAADFDEKIGGFVFRKEMSRRSDRFAHKNAKHRDRVIMLTGKTLATVKELVALHPTGPLFRRVNGKGFGKVTVVDRFIKLRKRLNMPGLTAYSYRHTWATEMLKAGMDVDTLASLMGNSAAVIRQHYSHLLADRQGLREKLERFTGASGS